MDSSVHRSSIRRFVNRAAVALVLLGLPGSGRARAEPAGPKCPSQSKQLAALQLKDGDGWLLACQAEADGTLLLAALQQRTAEREKETPSRLALIVSVIAPGQAPQRTQVKLDTKLFGAGDSTELQIAAHKLGDAPVVRIVYSSEAGEDYYSTSEVVTFVARTGAGLQHLWTGSGSSSSRSMDLCYVTSTARFTLNPDGSLQRTIRSRYSINKANYREDEPFRRIAKECRGPATSSKRFPLAVRLP